MHFNFSLSLGPSTSHAHTHTCMMSSFLHIDRATRPIAPSSSFACIAFVVVAAAAVVVAVAVVVAAALSHVLYALLSPYCSVNYVLCECVYVL